MIRREGTAIPDDGIPVLTDVVETAALVPSPETGDDPTDGTPPAADASASMAMFPELEPGAIVELEREQEPFGIDAPFASSPVVESESRDAMETRIFESLAARLDRLIDERLDPVIEGSIEAAFAGVKAGLSASLNQAVREAVEQAVRDEFERRADSGSIRP